MKTILRRKIKALPIALALAAGSFGAQAAINTGAFGGASGELFISVWDQVASTSYTFDLGITADAFMADATTPRTWELDQRFIDFAATGNPLAFNIGASNGYAGLFTDGVVNSSYGVLASHLVGFPLNPNAIANASIGTQFISSFTARLNFVNQSIVADNPGATLTDYDANLSEISSSGQSAYFTNFWGLTMKNIPWTASAKVRQGLDADNNPIPDTSLDMYFIHGNPNGVSALVTAIATDYHFKLDPTTATLTYTTTAVPLPASVWLLLSALGGLSIFRRRGDKAQD